MDHKDLCEHTRIRLIAAAVGHQQCTKTAGTEVQIPGTDKRILIGNDAYLARVAAPATAFPNDGREPDWDGYAAAEAAHADELALPPKPHTTYNGYSDGSEPLWTAEQMEDYARAAIIHAAAICDGVAAKSKNSLFRSGAKICAGEIRAVQAAAGADQVDSEGGHHD